jgi:16S rRNA (uracil1498-N3)-methyltransferase
MAKNPAHGVPRFLAADLDVAAREVRLPPGESRHLTRVLRLGPGSIVGVFDGRGHEFLARVSAAHDEGAVLEIVERVDAAPESAVPFTLVQALLKGPSMDDVVRDATMMGAAAVQPVLTMHTAVKLARERGVERWRRIAVASAKQCRRATVPEIGEPMPLESALANRAADLRLMFVEPGANRATESLKGLLGARRIVSADLIVGPEGGWGPQEIDAAIAAQCVLVTLGALTLRADAVPMAAMSVFRVLSE